MLTPADFLIWKDSCQLTENGRRAFFQAYEQRKATEVTRLAARILPIARTYPGLRPGRIEASTSFLFCIDRLRDLSRSSTGPN
jgi:hypothetical protein